MHKHEKRPHGIQGPVGHKGPSSAELQPSRDEMLDWLARETLLNVSEMAADMPDEALHVFILSFSRQIIAFKDPMAAEKLREGGNLWRYWKNRQKSRPKL